MDDRVRIRSGAWLRVFICAETDSAVCRLASLNFVAVVQHRSRVGPAHRVGVLDTYTRASLQICSGGANGNHHSLCDRRAHRLALDDRARRQAETIRLAKNDRRSTCYGHALANDSRGLSGGDLVA